MKYRAQGDATAYATDKSPLNHRILRYADVLLMYAEACNELGDDASARDALNQVRRRAKLDDVTAVERHCKVPFAWSAVWNWLSSRTVCMISAAGLIQMVKR